MSDAFTDRLSAYHDGDLAGDERARTEAHLEKCAECRATLEQFRALDGLVDAQHDRPPVRDLWPAIATGLAERPQAPWLRRWAWAASFAALGLLAGATWWFARSAPGESPAPSANPRIDAYLEVSGELRERLDEMDAIDPALAERLRDDLAAFDRAVEETQHALREAPNDPFLEEHLARTLRSQVRYLRRTDLYAGAEDDGGGS